MNYLAITKMASGCGITDYILSEPLREYCDLGIVLAGILLILIFLFYKKSLV